MLSAYCYRPSSVVCRCVSRSSEPCKNGWSHRDAVCVDDSGGPRETPVAYSEPLRANTVLRPFSTIQPSSLPLWFFFFLSFFFFSTLYLWGHWTDLNQTWTHIYLWLLFEKFGPNSPWVAARNRFLGKNFEFWPNISLQRNMISIIGKKLVNLKVLLYMPPKFEKRWSRIG